MRLACGITCAHDCLQVAEVEAADQGDGFDVLFLGDSIMESTRHAVHLEKNKTAFDPILSLSVC